MAEKLGVEAQFVVIDWDNKIMELNSKNIDVVWNGMTLTDEVTSSMNCTNAYCKKRSGGHHRSAVNRFSLDSYLLYAKAGSLRSLPLPLPFQIQGCDAKCF